MNADQKATMVQEKPGAREVVNVFAVVAFVYGLDGLTASTDGGDANVGVARALGALSIAIAVGLLRNHASPLPKSSEWVMRGAAALALLLSAAMLALMKEGTGSWAPWIHALTGILPLVIRLDRAPTRRAGDSKPIIHGTMSWLDGL